jgi:hypothetical protein
VITIDCNTPPVQGPFLIDGFGRSYAAGFPFDDCIADPSNLTTRSTLNYNSSNLVPQSVGTEVHLAQSAFHAAPTASTHVQFTSSHFGDCIADPSNLTTGSALNYNSSNLVPQSVGTEVHLAQSAFYAAPTASAHGQFTSSPFGDRIADPSNLPTGSALNYNSSNHMPQIVGTEVRLAQSAFHVAPTASTQGRFTCSSCGIAFKRKGDLTRHQKSHGLTKFYCVYANCPRRVYTKGYHRKDKLVDHLEFSHKMTKEDARRWVCKW